MGNARTFHMKGTGGAAFDLDVPTETQALERFLAKIEAGELTALDEDGDPIDRMVLLDELRPAADDTDGDDDGALDADLGAMSARRLRAYAAERGVDLGDAKTKAEILAVLEANPDD